MGGTLGAMHAAAHPDAMASLTTLAAPVRAAGILADWTRSPAFDPRALVEAFGNVPWPLLQASFLMLRPTLTPSKVAFIWDRAIRGKWSLDFVESFLAKEKWASDNVALPGEVFRAWVEDIYRDDGLVRGTMTLHGRPVRLESITTPLHALTFEDDYIVPLDSAQPLTERAASKDLVATHLPGGHVGAVVSRGARQHLWPLMAGFWAARDGRPVDVEAIPQPVR
jgi:polyhydroxyalkanoate synthase